MSAMDIGIAAGGSLVSLGFYTYSCLGKRKKQKLHQQRLSAIVMGVGTGKSTLKNELDTHNGIHIVDVSESINDDNSTNKKLSYLANANTYVKQLLVDFKKSKFLLLCESVEEALHVGVDLDNVFLCVPSNKLFDSLIQKLNSTQLDKKEAMQRSRMNLVRDCKKEQLNIFNSFDELKSVLKAAYKLESQF